MNRERILRRNFNWRFYALSSSLNWNLILLGWLESSKLMSERWFKSTDSSMNLLFYYIVFFYCSKWKSFYYIFLCIFWSLFSKKKLFIGRVVLSMAITIFMEYHVKFALKFLFLWIYMCSLCQTSSNSKKKTCTAWTVHSPSVLAYCVAMTVGKLYLTILGHSHAFTEWATVAVEFPMEPLKVYDDGCGFFMSPIGWKI